MVSVLTDLRDRNLATGLQNLLRQIEPDFRELLPQGSTIAKHIAETVFRHPAIAHAGTRAKAVSQSDLIRVETFVRTNPQLRSMPPPNRNSRTCSTRVCRAVRTT
jgi:hypothetical protein